jgi:hypothetical protein
MNYFNQNSATKKDYFLSISNHLDNAQLHLSYVLSKGIKMNTQVIFLSTGNAVKYDFQVYKDLPDYM